MGYGYGPEKEFMSPHGLNECVMFSDIALYYGPLIHRQIQGVLDLSRDSVPSSDVTLIFAVSRNLHTTIYCLSQIMDRTLLFLHGVSHSEQ